MATAVFGHNALVAPARGPLLAPPCPSARPRQGLRRLQGPAPPQGSLPQDAPRDGLLLRRR
eukprot:4963463-Lingulodinium_polyedra.AAC.1